MHRKNFTVPARRQAIVFAAALFTLFSASGQPQVAKPTFPKYTVDLADIGGTGDGVTLNTAAFAKAIAAISEKGGGELVVPPGIWLTGPIKLCSNLNLHLERGALIKFSGDFNLC